MTRSKKGYSFVAKDPTIDLWRRALEVSGLTPRECADEARLARSTTHAWDKGETRKPQGLTMLNAMRACGFRQQWTDGKTVLKVRYD